MNHPLAANVVALRPGLEGLIVKYCTDPEQTAEPGLVDKQLMKVVQALSHPQAGKHGIADDSAEGAFGNSPRGFSRGGSFGGGGGFRGGYGGGGGGYRDNRGGGSYHGGSGYGRGGGYRGGGGGYRGRGGYGGGGYSGGGGGRGRGGFRGGY